MRFTELRQRFTGQWPKWETTDNDPGINGVPLPSKFATPAGSVVCPKCGAPALAAATTCNNCGSALGSSAAETVISSSASAIPDAPTSVSNSSSPSSAETLESSVLPHPLAAQSDLSKRTPDFGPRYRVERMLGEGGMGTVYKAWDKELERTVALKLVRRDLTHDPYVSERFKQELLLASKISHRNILRIHDLGDGPGDTKFISMAYVEGQDLNQLLRKERKLPLDRALNIARQLCAALDAAHAEGVVHRDLKPQNILVDQHDHIYVSDFGLAKSLESDLGMTRTGQFLGTPRYMSPEQAEIGHVDHRSDLYTFGLILCEMVTGNLPFEHVESTMQMMYQRVHETPKDPKRLNPDLPEYLAQIIQKCLEQDVNLRYQSAREILADLEASHAPARTHPSWVVGAVTAVQRGPRNVWLVVAAALVVLLGVFTVPRVRQALFSGTAKTTTATPAGPATSLGILPFHNASGDPALDWLGPSLADMLSTDVGQSAQLRTISPERLHQVLSDLRITPGTSIDPTMVGRIAEFSNADTLVSGQYARFGSQIRIDATLQDLKHGRNVPIKIDAVDEKDIPGAVDRLAAAIRNNLAFSPDIINELKASSFQPSSGSAPALRDYNQGIQFLREGKNLDAVRAFQSATKEDAEFALAYSRLAGADSALGYDGDAEQVSRKAVELSQQLPMAEKYLIQATHAQVMKDNKKAIEAFENLAKSLPDNSDVESALGSLYTETGDYDKARGQLSRLLVSDPKNVKALWQMGVVEFMSGNPQAALEPLNKGLSLAVQLDAQELKALILQSLGISYRMINKPDDAMRSYQDAMAINRRLGLKRNLAGNLVEMAVLQNTQGKADAALADYSQALQLQREIGMKKEVGDTLNGIGTVYQSEGDYDKALQSYKESLQIQRDTGDENYQALCLNNIGGVYLGKGDTDNALTYLQQALQLREKLNIAGAIAETLANLGQVYSITGQYGQALTTSMRALDLWRKAGNARGAADESHDIGLVFLYQGRFGAAINAMQDAVNGYRAVGDRSTEMVELLNDLADTLAQAGRASESASLLSEARTIAHDLKNESLQAELLKTQGDIQRYRGDWKSAKNFYDQASRAAAHGTDPGEILISKLHVAEAATGEGKAPSVLREFRNLTQQADRRNLKYLSLESSADMAEAMIHSKDYSHAQQELRTDLGKSEKLGSRYQTARILYLLGQALRLSGNSDEARGHYRQALSLIDDMRKEPGAEKLLERSDLKSMFTEAARFADAKN